MWNKIKEQIPCAPSRSVPGVCLVFKYTYTIQNVYRLLSRRVRAYINTMYIVLCRRSLSNVEKLSVWYLASMCTP